MLHATSRLRTSLAAAAAAGLLLSACGGSQEATTDATTDGTAGQASETKDTGAQDAGSSTTTNERVDESGDEVAGDFDHPVLQSVATRPDGSTVTVADFAGQTVFVETFATWCSTCRRQLKDTNVAAGQAGDDVAFLVLSVETNLDPAELDAYAAENGFDNLQFAVLDADGLVAFDAQFGRSVLNAPSTPKFVVAPDGTIGPMTTGLESVDEILAQVA